MSVLKSFERDDLQDNQYGIPSLRKYPLTDEEHVIKAVQFFKYADRKHQKQLRDNIIRRAKELNMNYSDWSINESFQNASNENSEEVIEVLNALHDKLCKFEYGIPIKGKISDVPPGEEFMNKYFSLSPDNFVKYGGGVCWDFTEYERDYLEKRGIAYRQIYVIAQHKECPTHTFIVCESEGKFIYIEYSFERVSSMIHGVKSFDSLEDICKLVTTMMFGCNDSLKELEKFRYEVREFFDHPPYNSTCEEYMEWMTNNSKLIDRGWAYKSDYENIISESYVQESNKIPNKVEDFQFDRMYFGSYKKFDREVDVNDGFLFVTPFIGIASIFTANRKDYKIPHGNYNIAYEEWCYIPSKLRKPLHQSHVIVQGKFDKEYEDHEFESIGYIYEINMEDLLDNVYQYDWMNKTKEFLIGDVKKVQFDKCIEHKMHVHVTYENSLKTHKDTNNVQESFQSKKSDECKNVNKALTDDEPTDILDEELPDDIF